MRAAWSFGGESRAAGPRARIRTAGFDVVPTDCLALALKNALPDATELARGFYSNSPLSPGTAKSSIEGAALGGRVRRGGRIVSVPFASDIREIDFGDGRGARPAMS